MYQPQIKLSAIPRQKLRQLSNSKPGKKIDSAACCTGKPGINRYPAMQITYDITKNRLRLSPRVTIGIAPAWPTLDCASGRDPAMLCIWLMMAPPAFATSSHRTDQQLVSGFLLFIAERR